MIRPAESKPMGENRTKCVKQQKAPTKSQLNPTRPPAEEYSERNGKQRRYHCSGKLESVITKRLQDCRCSDDQIIERRCRVGRGSDWKVLEIMSPNDRSGMFEADSCSRHPRIAVRVHKIDLVACEYVRVISATRDVHESDDDHQLEQEQNAAAHPNI